MNPSSVDDPAWRYRLGAGRLVPAALACGIWRTREGRGERSGHDDWSTGDGGDDDGD